MDRSLIQKRIVLTSLLVYTHFARFAANYNLKKNNPSFAIHVGSKLHKILKILKSIQKSYISKSSSFKISKWRACSSVMNTKKIKNYFALHANYFHVIHALILEITRAITLKILKRLNKY